MLRIALLACLLSAAAAAQTSTSVNLSFSGTEVTVTFGTAIGTLSPFGTSTVALTGTPTGPTSGNFEFDFGFGNGDTLTASGPGLIGNTTVSGTATVTTGTGAFAKATGSFSFTVSIDDSVDPNPFTISGSGTVVLASGSGGAIPAIACTSSSTGATCSVIICSEGGGSSLPISPERSQAVMSPRDSSTPAASCSSTPLDLAEVPGGATLPVLVFEGGGSTSPVLAFLACCGGSTGTLPVLTFEGGGSTLPVLAESTGGSTLPISPEHPAASTATPAGNPLEIATPLQTAAASYTAVAQCDGAPATCWLTVPLPSGTIAASSRAAITAYVNPVGQASGVYTGNVAVTITPKGGTATVVNVPVTMLATASQPTIALSQNGVHLTSQGGSGHLAQSILVANVGAGSLTFTATVSALSGGNWLSITPSSGTAPAQVTIQANAAGLAPGNYFGRVDFSPSGTANAAQSVEVELTVLASTATPDATVSPTGLVFAAGGPSQTVQVATPTSRALTITTKVAFANGSGWFSAKVSGGTVTVTPTAAGLAAGTYVGTLDIHIAETSTDHLVTVVLVVPKPAPCTPTRLLPVITNLEGSFLVVAGFPVPLQAQVVDDCGVALNTGAVQAYFPRTADPSASLISLGGGQWSGTWMPHSLAGGTAAVGIMASGPSIFGSTGVIGTLSANTSAPLAFAGGVVNAASIQVAPLAPGSFFSIFGSNLAAALASAKIFPYPTTLSDTQVFLGGEALPLEVAAGGQINAVIPYDAAINGFQQLIVQRNGMNSMPETILLSQAQPAVFTLDQSGKGAGAIVVIKADGTQFVNGPSSPASAGDVLVIYGTGLGAVTPPVVAGAAAPSSTYTYTVNTTTVTIGGKAAQVLFAGLTPGYASLYQINVVVPPGITAGSNVPVVVSDGGASSPVVTVTIR